MDSPPLTNTSTDTGPEAIRKNFAAVASATGTPEPGDGTRQMTVDLGQQILPLARNVGMFMRSAPIFRHCESIATVNEAGDIALMTSERFCSWVESYLSFTERGKDTVTAKSIGKDLASKILAADQFREHLRELKAVSKVRIPVWNDEGENRTVELSPEGFHAPTGLLVVNRIPYDEEMSAEEAWDFLWGVLKDFPFDIEGAANVKLSRSFAAQIAAMLGAFCHALLPEGAPRPMIIHLANQTGSGKSLLMRIGLAPLYGMFDDYPIPPDEKGWEQLFTTTASGRKQYLVLDDVKSLNSHALNRWITSPRHAWRVMYSHQEGSVAKSTQTWATGNNLTVSPDIDRRSLVVELFCADEATGRVFPREITQTWLYSDSTRAKFLAAMWALVKIWISKGSPLMKTHCRGSFEEYSSLIGGMVIACGFENPFKPRNTEAVGGDESTRALKLVLSQIIGQASIDSPPVLDTSAILEAAEAGGMLDLIVGYAKDAKKSLGHKLKALKGRHLLDSQNRLYEFGRRGIASGAKYPVKFLNVDP